MICRHPRIMLGGNFYVIGICADCDAYALPLIETGTAETVKQGSVRSMRGR